MRRSPLQVCLATRSRLSVPSVRPSPRPRRRAAWLRAAAPQTPHRLPARSLKPRLARASPKPSNHHALPTPTSPATDCRPLATSPQTVYTSRVSHATPIRSASPAPATQPESAPCPPIRRPPSSGSSPPRKRAPPASPAPGYPAPTPPPAALTLPRAAPPTAHRAPSPTPAATRNRHSPGPPPCPSPLTALPFLHRPPNPAKMHPAPPQEFFGKNSYCARGPQFRLPRPPPTAARLRPSGLPRFSTRPSSRKARQSASGLWSRRSSTLNRYVHPTRPCRFPRPQNPPKLAPRGRQPP